MGVKRFLSVMSTVFHRLNFLLRPDVLSVRRCLLEVWGISIFPVAVTLNRFFAALFVFSFGTF